MKLRDKIETSLLLGMIESESHAEYLRYRNEIESPLSNICESADALGPLVLKEQMGLLRWKLVGNLTYSRFRKGDRVEIRTQKSNSNFSAEFSKNWKVDEVIYPTPGRIEVIISGDNPLNITDVGVKEVFLFKESSTLFNRILKKRLRDISDSNRPVLLDTGAYNLSTQDAKFRKHFENLNSTQQSAIEYLIKNNLSGAIQGPPGTGKTQLLKAAVSLALQSKMRVLVTSFTNAAVDNLIARLVTDKFDANWVRVGNPVKVKSENYIDHLNGINLTTNFDLDMEEDLIGSTLHKLAFSTKVPKVDLLIIDEAGQVPIYFWPFIQRLANRVVLVGDQYQLPPVLAAEHKNLSFDNVFSYSLEIDSPMLETQYRMRKEIQAWSSEKFYKGKLAPHSSVADRDHFIGHRAFFGDTFVSAKMFDSRNSNKHSIAEADFIADKIEYLIKSKTNLDLVGVICPYRAQAGVVNSVLQSRLGVEDAAKVQVDTVERFQGQEKEAIFLSCGSSGASQSELDFLSDSKRLNVSITRAKSRFYCLFDEQLWEQSKKSYDLNEFLRWITYGKISIRRAA